VQLLFGYVHGITLAFGVTVLGVAIDYPIHLFSHLTGGQSLIQSLRRIWPTLRLGVITTASGYLAMTATDFTGLAQLGSFAMIGLLGAAAATRWVLPALLPADYCPVVSPPFARQGLGQQLLQPGRTALVISVVAGIAALMVVVIHKDSLWENDLAALSPIPKGQLALDRQLRNDLGAGEATHALLIKAADEQSALQRSESLRPVLAQLERQGVIEGFDLPSRYLPSIETQRRRQQALPPAPTVGANVQQALRNLPFKAGQFTPFVQAVADSKRLPPLTYEQIQDTPLGLKVSSLLFPRDDAWLAFVALHGVNQTQALQTAIDNLDTPGVFYLNMKAATNELIGNFRDETLARMQWAALLILAVLAGGVRSARRLAAALIPVIFAIGADMALLLLMGERLSLFNLVALLLVFGIGVDFGLFFSRRETQWAMRRRTLHALVVCAISTVSVFGILSVSQVPVLADIGLTVWLGVLLCFLFSLLLSQQGKTTGA
jgi:predicted exporter